MFSSLEYKLKFSNKSLALAFLFHSTLAPNGFNVSLKLVIIALVIGILIFIILYNSIRAGSTLGNFSEILLASLIDEAYVGYINLQYVLDCFPLRHDYMHGYGYLINIIMLRPGADLDFTLTLKQILGLDFDGGGVTPTILGELYLNFGFVGCGIGMFFVGILYQRITSSLKKSDLYYIPAWLTVTFCIAIRGGLANVEISILLNLIMYMCICYATHKIRLKKK